MVLMADTGTDARPPLLPARAALYLDFDGTLAAFAPHPDGVTVDKSLPALLSGLRERLDGAVALVTGRGLASLDALIAPHRFPGAGLHGLELRSHPGDAARVGGTADADALARNLGQRFADDPRIIIEHKGPAVALHYRRARARADECIAAMRELVAGTELQVIAGHAVVEARPCDGSPHDRRSPAANQSSSVMTSRMRMASARLLSSTATASKSGRVRASRAIASPGSGACTTGFARALRHWRRGVRNEFRCNPRPRRHRQLHCLGTHRPGGAHRMELSAAPRRRPGIPFPDRRVSSSRRARILVD
jgi:hypothetical protein